jgi:hypothetical protein
MAAVAAVVIFLFNNVGIFNRALGPVGARV